MRETRWPGSPRSTAYGDIEHEHHARGHRRPDREFDLCAQRLGGDWAKRVKAARLPGWQLTFETAGALARLPSYKEPVPLSESEVKARVRSLLKRRGDCGWSGLMELILSGRARSGVYWLVEKRDQWPAAMATWPEERVRAMTFMLRMDDELKLPDAVALFETAETRAELTLAHWLTGRTWAKGSRVIEVMEAAQLSLAVRLGVKPWQMGHFRHLYTNRVETEELINLRALTRLGAVRNEEDMLAWSLQSNGVGGDPT